MGHFSHGPLSRKTVHLEIARPSINVAASSVEFFRTTPCALDDHIKESRRGSVFVAKAQRRPC